MAVRFERSRRLFLTGRGRDPAPCIRPPWSNAEGFEDLCTRCGACIEVCPEGIIALGEGGYPELCFADGACTFCGACADACPEPIFDLRRIPAFPHIVTISSGCLARHGVVCQSCGDVCPERAIRFELRLGGPPAPAVDEAACTGCGACIATCPANAIVPGAVRHLEPVDGRE